MSAILTNYALPRVLMSEPSGGEPSPADSSTYIKARLLLHYRGRITGAFVSMQQTPFQYTTAPFA